MTITILVFKTVYQSTSKHIQFRYVFVMSVPDESYSRNASWTLHITNTYNLPYLPL